MPGGSGRGAPAGPVRSGMERSGRAGFRGSDEASRAMGMTLSAIDPNVRWYATLVVLTVALVAVLAWAVRVWNDVKGEAVESSDDPDDLLDPLTRAFAAGQMSKDEYLRIK